jgi:hypothetical protein
LAPYSWLRFFAGGANYYLNPTTLDSICEFETEPTSIEIR